MSPLFKKTILFVFTVLSVMTGTFLFLSFSKEKEVYIEWGVLTCNVSSNPGYVFAHELIMDCVMLTHDGKISCYEGKLSRIGVDIGFTMAKTQTWSILALAKTPREKFLDGSYLGADIGASMLIGGGVGVNIGNFEQSFVLVPVSVYVHSGVNFTTSFTHLELKSLDMDFLA